VCTKSFLFFAETGKIPTALADLRHIANHVENYAVPDATFKSKTLFSQAVPYLMKTSFNTVPEALSATMEMLEDPTILEGILTGHVQMAVGDRFLVLVVQAITHGLPGDVLVAMQTANPASWAKIVAQATGVFADASLSSQDVEEKIVTAFQRNILGMQG
jgi:hypothetical protein